MLIARPDDALTEVIIREAIEIHRMFGPGLLESAYEALLAAALEDLGLRVDRQVAVPIRYRGRRIKVAYRIDLLVERAVVVEIKSIEKVVPPHSQQLLTHLRFGGYRTGLLMNFAGATLREGLSRIVNDRWTGGSAPQPPGDADSLGSDSKPPSATVDRARARGLGPLKQVRRVLQAWALFIADRVAPT